MENDVLDASAQVLSYLSATGLKRALLINFGEKMYQKNFSVTSVFSVAKHSCKNRHVVLSFTFK